MSIDARVPVLPVEARNPQGSNLDISGPASCRDLLEHWGNSIFSGAVDDGTLTEGSPWADSVLRRSLDLAAALFALFALLPIIALAALLVRVASGNPVFFRQERMGRHGRKFVLYKFRTMASEEGTGPSVTGARDSRITAIGRFLRRFKLDELPQIWNVLRGDMSLVGPRPKLPHLEPLYLTYRPGITGAATLFFRHEEELLADIPEDEIESFYDTWIKPAKASMDLHYMRDATLSSDLGILWRTASECFLSREDEADEPKGVVRMPAASMRTDRQPEKV